MDRLEAAATDHRDALGAFIATVQQGRPEVWNQAPADRKWSPAQATEHLRLTYEMGRSELAGREAFRIPTPWWQQRLFQWIYLSRGRLFLQEIDSTREKLMRHAQSAGTSLGVCSLAHRNAPSVPYGHANA